MRETARLQYGEGTLDEQEWAEATLTRLCLNDLEAVLDDLMAMTPRSPAAGDSIRRFSLYLAGQAGPVGYDELRRRGLPRGSGGMNPQTS